MLNQEVKFIWTFKYSLLMNIDFSETSKKATLQIIECSRYGWNLSHHYKVVERGKKTHPHAL
jgi:hypothetical protein